VADDAVNTAAILFLEDLQRPGKPAKLPATDAEFRRKYLTIVRNHVIDCTRGAAKQEMPIHAHWSKAPEPRVGGRKVPDRPLDRIFARNDGGEYDAPARPVPRDKDTTEELDQILRCHLAELPQMQREVVEQTFLQGRKRAEVSSRLAISVNTYDNHLRAAFGTLRHLLSNDADTYTEADRTVWYDLIEELRERYEESRIRRAATKSRALSNSIGDRSNSEGDAGKSVRSGAA
jgi:DNA-directed RNA polymerase specialized sigma24 family protein